MPTAPTILWFRKDLRLGDNSALKAAVEAGAPVIPLFIWSPNESARLGPRCRFKVVATPGFEEPK